MKWLAGLVALFSISSVVATRPALAGVKLLRQPRTFPIVISQPGSYRLTKNITVPDENTTAISVQADYVTIDLNGFSIQGPVVCAGTPVTSCSPSHGTGSGVDGLGRRGLTVRNGSVHGMGYRGINITGRVENVTVEENGDYGILATIVTGSQANRNRRLGMGGAAVSSCTAVGNGDYGIVVDAGAVINSTANNNGGGIYSFGSVSNCDASYNSGYGIAGPPATVSNSRAYSNTTFGIDAITATGCTAQFNGGSPQISAKGITGHNICGDPGSPCP